MSEQHIYMLGIGGIGMSALAQYYAAHGYKVYGKDRSFSEVTDLLEKKGIQVAKDEGESSLPDECDLLVYSDAIPENHLDRVQARKLDIRELSYFEALGEVTKGHKTIAVAGTHGKTTTTAMLTKILVEAGKVPTAIIGSVVKDFQSNYVSGDEDLFVVEACEYRDHVLKLAPDILVITNLEWDHSDWFPDLSAVQATFQKVIATLPQTGVVITDLSNANITALHFPDHLTVIDYGKESVPDLNLLGAFNLANAQAAKATAKAFDESVGDEVIDDALRGFQGSWRRFEYIGKTENGAAVYDDYAHHPTAIKETLLAVREKFADKQLVVLFHPHLFSRTESLFNEFAESLSLADQVYLLPIYPAREKAEDYPNVSSENLAKAISEISGNASVVKDHDEAVKKIAAYVGDTIVLTLGAGEGNVVAKKVVKK